MKIEKIGKTQIITADEGKCFKGENINSILTIIFLGKYDSKDNYEEVDIVSYEQELAILNHREDGMSEIDIEAAIIEDNLEAPIQTPLGEM